MSKVALFFLFANVIAAFSQPYTFPATINPADSGLVSSPARRTMSCSETTTPIIVDGVKDAQWDLITPTNFDRFIMCRTTLTNGVYSCKPDGPGTWTPSRIPNSKYDFSAAFRITYDDDYLYAFYDITDSEVNDGVINAGISERLELVEAPYPDSVQQAWNGHYPPYSGTAGVLQKKFAYWNYLGAFKWNFFLIANGKCNMGADEKADAMAKIDYVQRTSSCQCAWKMKSDGTGYILEAALSLKIGLSDSANNPYTLPAPGQTKQIAFDMFVYDYDQGAKLIKASWNAQDDNVWDEMLYTGKLSLGGPGGSCNTIMPTASNTTVCIGKSTTLYAAGGKNYRWYDSYSGSIPIATTSSFNTPILNYNTTYYVSNYDSCESPRKQVNVSVISSSTAKINKLKGAIYNCHSLPEQLAGTPAGGTFSGDGVQVGWFVPSTAKVNQLNMIYYSYGDIVSGCQSKDSLAVFVFPCSGLSNHDDEDINIFPNPSEDIINVEIKDARGSISLVILDELGKIIFEDFRSDVEEYKKEIDLSNLKTGLYILKMTLNDRVFISKIIKE